MSDRPPTHDELAAMIKECAGVTVDPAALSRRPDLTFEELGVDSLGVLGVVAALENRYGIRLAGDTEQSQRPDQLRALVETTIATEATDARTH
jgi:minimal PKS acyl carrier protein